MLRETESVWMGPLPNSVYAVVTRLQQLENIEEIFRDLMPRVRVRLPSGQWLSVQATRLSAMDGHRQVAVIIEPAGPTELAPLIVSAYSLTGREREIAELVLQGLSTKQIAATLFITAGTRRDLRVSAEVIHRLAVRRARCADCKRSEAVLPGFVTWGRLDAVEVIGPAVEAMCSGVGMRRAADDLGLRHTTVRDWRRRFTRRADLLAVGFCRYCVAVGDLAPRLSGRPEVLALAALKAAWSAARRRFGVGVGGLWRPGNAVVGGHLLSPNMDPPWAAG